MRKLIVALGFIVLAIPNLNAAELESVKAGTGTVKFNSLIQVWYVNDPTRTPSQADQTFDFRRVELKFSGSVLENTSWFAMIDVAKTLSSTGDNKVIQDVGLVYSPLSDLELTVGQFKTLTTAESMDTKASELLFPERSYVARYYGERRDLGAQVSYKLDAFRFRAMISNGLDTSGNTQANRTDTNRSKEAHGRIDGEFFEKALRVGVFHSGGTYGAPTTTVYRSHNGADARFEWEKINVFAAYILGNDDTTKTTGISGQASYKFNECWQLGLGAESLSYRPDGGTEVVGSAYALGLNYFLLNHNAKIQLSNTWLKNLSGNLGKYQFNATPPTERDASTVTTLAFQMAI
ncbi:MAG: outer membrane beta-barrel protein [Oligoflexia bacterium]|nr:outer membrane beta-barrel protein [Oligoflexia bacterium]